VKLHPSETVFEGGPERDRTPVEETLSPIDSAAWSLIRISDLKRAIAAIDADVVSLAPRLKEEVEELSRLANRRRSPNVEARQARRAEQVLQAMAASDGVAYRGLLPEMFPDPDDWGGCTNETIKQRVRRLRKDGWLPPPDQYGRPGPRLIAWREERHR
jgi:lysophospholipase L1-like esterase